MSKCNHTPDEVQDAIDVDQECPLCLATRLKELAESAEEYAGAHPDDPHWISIERRFNTALGEARR